MLSSVEHSFSSIRSKMCVRIVCRRVPRRVVSKHRTRNRRPHPKTKSNDHSEASDW